MPKKKVGIIGCGTIGSAIARAVLHDFAPHAALTCICDHSEEKAKALRAALNSRIRITNLETLIRSCDLVIEAASVHVVHDVVRFAAKYKKEMLIMSVGGLLKSEALVTKDRVKLWVPSGALAGVDALIAARESKIKKVKLVTRKPPRGLNEAPYFKRVPFPGLEGNKEYRVFQGTAAQAVENFPQNINVAAVLSLAGIGAKQTEVEIWTSKSYSVNQHEITVEGDFGSFQTVTRNVPSKENPKTSALAIYSAKATLRRIFSNVKIGT